MPACEETPEVVTHMHGNAATHTQLPTPGPHLAGHHVRVLLVHRLQRAEYRAAGRNELALWVQQLGLATQQDEPAVGHTTRETPATPRRLTSRRLRHAYSELAIAPRANTVAAALATM